MKNVPDYDRLDWDSEFFGVEIGRVRTGSNGLADTATRAKADGIECLYFLAESSDHESHRAALEAGFSLVDTRVTYSIATLRRAEQTEVRHTIRPAKPDDVEPLTATARAGFKDSRFFFDARFSDERAADLYAVWLENAVVHGYHDEVFVAEREGSPLGFVTVDLHERPDGNVGEIGLIGVTPEARGEGVGSALVEHASRWYLDRGASAAEVVTQARNLGAQRLYIRHGYTLSRVQLWFHWWANT